MNESEPLIYAAQQAIYALQSGLDALGDFQAEEHDWAADTLRDMKDAKAQLATALYEYTALQALHAANKKRGAMGDNDKIIMDLLAALEQTAVGISALADAYGEIQHRADTKDRRAMAVEEALDEGYPFDQDCLELAISVGSWLRSVRAAAGILTI